MSWINKVLEACEEAETPRNYLYWAGVSIISAVTSPNVFLNRGGVYNLSPNIFVMEIGESGLGKGLPLHLAEKLVTMAGTTRVISGRNTIQSILQDLGRTETDEKNGIPKFKDARGFIVSGEFSTLLQEDKAALPIITQLYDTHYLKDVPWENKTKNSGRDKLIKPCITLLGGSTQEHFANVVPEADVKGGFVGRILTVYEEQRYKVNPLDDTDAVNNIPYAELVEWLKTIALVQGPFKYSDSSRKLWREFYETIRTKKVQDETGAVNRLPDNVLKVAMCLSLADDVDLIIHTKHLEESIARCMQLTIDSRKLTGGQGKGQLGKQTHLVIQILYRADDHESTKSRILYAYYGQFDTYDLDRIIETLENAGMIETRNRDGDVVIRMTEKAITNLKILMEKV